MILNFYKCGLSKFATQSIILVVVNQTDRQNIFSDNICSFFSFTGWATSNKIYDTCT